MFFVVLFFPWFHNISGVKKKKERMNQLMSTNLKERMIVCNPFDEIDYCTVCECGVVSEWRDIFALFFQKEEWVPEKVTMNIFKYTIISFVKRSFGRFYAGIMTKIPWWLKTNNKLTEQAS